MTVQGGRVAVVTGGAGGIGAATARRLAADGAAVAVLDLDGAAAAEVAGPLGGLGLACDIADPAAVAAAVAAVVERYGRIDVLVNNAGLHRGAPFLDLPAATWDAVVAVNLTGPFAVTQAVAAHMRDAGYGRVVFVGSLAGTVGNAGYAAYAAAKSGLVGLVRTLAQELGPHGVTGNVVAPGYVDTPMLRAALARRGQAFDDMAATASAATAVRRLGRPEDVAAAVAYFARPDSGFVTGQVLHVTGSP